ncbi:Alpha/Beta hydrolase protein [Aspergillus welwitschiae]|uniref:Alpha/Beta hydrolase protein n=1 Tax=Aspergillus welwitschiae TaxID=1341132 RepID=A0A3F3PI68_9EURO|nr:Alpha/Beta hydrolase protein [Aspergillus welwitschiae]RDH26412.1 Alpha/Beta hydrolase protein [Aspergillus welwitschiae]
MPSDSSMELPLAQTKSGSYYGVYTPQYEEDYFLGMPFAKPSLAHLRWANREKERIGYCSDQKGYLQSEDCLYLNVARGCFAQGGTPDLRYNLTFIVEHSVTIGQPIIALANEGSLNLWLKDQRLALHWVKENIAGFGDLIYGRSAGSESVGYQVRAYNGRDDGLFRGGMMESGAVRTGSASKLTWTYELWFQKIADEAGCSQAICKLDCLRRVPFTVLNNILNTTANDTTPYNWRPTVNGDFVARFPSEQLGAGDFVKVPIMIGYTTDKGTTECPEPVNTTAELKEYLSSTTTYGWALDERVVSELFELYHNNTSLGIPSFEKPGGNVPFPQTYGAISRQIAAYHGDAQFIAATRYTSELWAAHNLTAYCYQFNTKTDDYNGHGFSPNPFVDARESYTDLKYLMSGSWISFTNSLDPIEWTRCGRNATRTEYRTDANVLVGIALINANRRAYQRLWVSSRL